MAEQPPADQPSSDSTKGPKAEALSGKELDDALANAAALAAHISEEVNDNESSELGTRGQDLATQPADLDAELQELERLVTATGKELTEQADVPADTTTSADQDESMPSLSEATPISLTSAEHESPPAEQADPTSPTTTQDAMAELTTPGPATVAATSHDAEAKRQSEPPPADASDEAQETWQALWLSRLRDAVHCLLKRLLPLGLAAGRRIVQALELIDRPFARLGDSARRVIGWLAIATTGTAVLVFLYSLV